MVAGGIKEGPLRLLVRGGWVHHLVVVGVEVVEVVEVVVQGSEGKSRTVSTKTA